MIQYTDRMRNCHQICVYFSLDICQILYYWVDFTYIWYLVLTVGRQRKKVIKGEFFKSCCQVQRCEIRAWKFPNSSRRLTKHVFNYSWETISFVNLGIIFFLGKLGTLFYFGCQKIRNKCGCLYRLVISTFEENNFWLALED